MAAALSLVHGFEGPPEARQAIPQANRWANGIETCEGDFTSPGAQTSTGGVQRSPGGAERPRGGQPPPLGSA